MRFFSDFLWRGKIGQLLIELEEGRRMRVSKGNGDGIIKGGRKFKKEGYQRLGYIFKEGVVNQLKDLRY